MLESSASTLEDRIQNYLDKLEKLPQIRTQHNHENKHKVLNKGRNYQWQDKYQFYRKKGEHIIMDDEVVYVQLSHAVSKKEQTCTWTGVECTIHLKWLSLLSLSKSSAKILMTSSGQNNRRQQKKANKNNKRSRKCRLRSGQIRFLYQEKRWLKGELITCSSWKACRKENK